MYNMSDTEETLALIDIETAIPHSGPMSLLDHISHFEPGKLLAQVTLTNASSFAEDFGVPGWIGIEYMAQAVAAYAGREAQLEGRRIEIGFLVGSRRYQCLCDQFPLHQLLTIEVLETLRDPEGLSVYSCRILSDTTELASAKLNVYSPEDADEFLLG